MRKEFEIMGCVEVQPEVTKDAFLDALIAFVERSLRGNEVTVAIPIFRSIEC